MLILGACVSLAAAALGVLIAALRSAPEAFEDERGLQILRQPDAAATRRTRRRDSVRLHPRVKTA
jgi:hypothetical protein